MSEKSRPTSEKRTDKRRNINKREGREGDKYTNAIRKESKKYYLPIKILLVT
jgi:hypothetical protein